MRRTTSVGLALLHSRRPVLSPALAAHSGRVCVNVWSRLFSAASAAGPRDPRDATLASKQRARAPIESTTDSDVEDKDLMAEGLPEGADDANASPILPESQRVLRPGEVPADQGPLTQEQLDMILAPPSDMDPNEYNPRGYAQYPVDLSQTPGSTTVEHDFDNKEAFTELEPTTDKSMEEEQAELGTVYNRKNMEIQLFPEEEKQPEPIILPRKVPAHTLPASPDAPYVPRDLRFEPKSLVFNPPRRELPERVLNDLTTYAEYFQTPPAPPIEEIAYDPTPDYFKKKVTHIPRAKVDTHYVVERRAFKQAVHRMRVRYIKEVAERTARLHEWRELKRLANNEKTKAATLGQKAARLAKKREEAKLYWPKLKAYLDARDERVAMKRRINTAARRAKMVFRYATLRQDEIKQNGWVTDVADVPKRVTEKLFLQPTFPEGWFPDLVNPYALIKRGAVERTLEERLGMNVVEGQAEE